MSTVHIKGVLLGLDFKSGNLGCSALGYSFLKVLQDISISNNVYFDIISVNYNSIEIETNYYKLTDLPIHFKSRVFRQGFYDCIEKADFIIDFTGGDSFTDLYGFRRFAKESILKEFAIRKGNNCFILGPQTIGPFNNRLVKAWAGHIIKNANKVYVRDAMSQDYVRNLYGLTAELTTDIAFILPASHYEIKHYDLEKKRLGINASGLLWNGGYSGNNELGLKLDYKKLIRELIVETSKAFEIHLVSHVNAEAGSVEDDYTIALELQREYPDAIVPSRFSSPSEAKGYIANMDMFIGSRMHATVAAFSSGVPVIPIAYSRKFMGLYDGLQYPYVIDAKKVTTEEAISLCLEYIQVSDNLKHSVENGMKIVAEKNSDFIKSITTEIIKQQGSIPDFV